MEAKIEASNEQVEVLEENMLTSQKEMKSKIGALVSRMYIHQARTEVSQEETKAKMRIIQEKIEVATKFMAAELEDNQELGGRRPGMCRPKDAGKLPHGIKREDS
jgi:hypothetical protein